MNQKFKYIVVRIFLISEELKLRETCFTSALLAAARIFCSSFRFLEMIMAMLTGSSWKRSWREDRHSSSPIMKFRATQRRLETSLQVDL